MRKKNLIKIILIFFFLFLAIFIYSRFNTNTILNQNQTTETENEEVIYSANIIKEVNYVSTDLKGNQYHYKKWNLVTIKDIKQGEELTLTYTFYKI